VCWKAGGEEGIQQSENLTWVSREILEKSGSEGVGLELAGSSPCERPSACWDGEETIGAAVHLRPRVSGETGERSSTGHQDRQLGPRERKLLLKTSGWEGRACCGA
jgi:hypothetical protein